MAKNISDAKNYNSSFLYKQYDYETVLTNAIMSADRIEKESENFQDVIISTKRRQTTSVLVDILQSNNVILLYPLKPLPLAMNTFAAKDIRKDGKLKVFIDASQTLQMKDGFWVTKNVDAFVAQLVSAATALIYYSDPKKIYTNSTLVLESTYCFVELFMYIINYLRVSGYSENKERLKYVIALYYLCGVLWKDMNESTRNIAMKVSEIDRRHADIADMLMKDYEEAFVNIDTFIKAISRAFNLTDFTTEVFIDKAIKVIGNGTHFGWEIYPSFSRIITDAYAGVYLNRQKVIEKICARHMITYTNALFSLFQIIVKGK